MEPLIKFDTVYNGTILKRPSASCKTPYVADVILDDEIESVMAHTPALGCCGHSDKDSCVIMSKLIDGKGKVCKYRVELALHSEGDNKMCIGINPKLAETIAEECLKRNYVLNLCNIKSYHREVKVLNSRFDFAGIDENGDKFIMEIKNVPLADYVDVAKKDREKYRNEIENKNFNEKISYFPDGYRKKSTDVVSERALKHINELAEIKEKGIRTILCYVIQRTDIKHFQTSNIDIIYKKAVLDAYNKGVEIKTLVVEWNEKGECFFVKNDLPIKLDEFPE